MFFERCRTLAELKAEYKRLAMLHHPDMGGDLETMKAVPGVLEDPAPMVEVKSLDDSAVTLTVRAWAKTADFWSVYFAGIQSVKEAFEKAGVEIPFRQVDINIRQIPAQLLGSASNNLV